VIDELIHNAGNLSVGKKETTEDGVDKNFAVNVMAPLLLSRALVPALKAAQPTGRIQITSGGMPFDTLNVNDMEAANIPVGIANYSHSKRVMEAMAMSLSRELAPIPVNMVGGAQAAGTSMTGSIEFSDMPWIMKVFYLIIKLFVFNDDGGKSARKCAQPVVWAASASQEELGTGRSLLSAPKEGKFKAEVANPENQEIVMKYIESKIVAKQ
jgi:NAD(P)-dependent dehydrogenase (short-subunit alcohol dehydrogenase family)